jgi:hypothetical protein
MKYKILKNESPDELEKMVNKLIEQGWQPQGGVAFQMLLLGVSVKATALQAMIKP